MTNLIPSPALDLSHYQPGDVLILSDYDISRLSRAPTEFMVALRAAARRAGLGLRIEMDLRCNEYRITFNPTQG
jgi:hypothetical protein